MIKISASADGGPRSLCVHACESGHSILIFLTAPPLPVPQHRLASLPIHMEAASPFPEPWNYLLSFKIHFKKSIKVTQSPRVPRVRGGDPSGVAPGKVEGFFSAPGHPWKLFS